MKVQVEKFRWLDSKEGETDFYRLEREMEMERWRTGLDDEG